ncbi:hypothetical protein EHQ57_19045, partial [Leptospira wolffii]
MKRGFEFGKRFLAIAILLPFVATCLSDFGFGKGDVDFSKATWLVAQKVPFVAVNEGVPGQP